MGDLSPIEPDGLGIEDSMELMVIDDELGTALVGTEDAIAAFALEWDTALSPVPDRLRHNVAEDGQSGIWGPRGRSRIRGWQAIPRAVRSAEIRGNRHLSQDGA